MKIAIFGKLANLSWGLESLISKSQDRTEELLDEVFRRQECEDKMSFWLIHLPILILAGIAAFALIMHILYEIPPR